MKIELHILQNFAPSNLNRDDTGAPKDCELGGYRRARISSQCLKRAVRDTFEVDSLLKPDDLAVRTKRLVQNVVEHLATEHRSDRARACDIVAATLAGAGLNVKAAEDYKTEYLLFFPRRHLVQLAELVDRHWDTLAGLGLAKSEATDQADADAPAKKVVGGKKKAKSDKKSAFPKEIAEELMPILEDAKRSPDLALFGRMIADTPSWNVEASCQVAHAISTNRVSMDFDFFTAVDDLRPNDTAGSDMMGTVQFNSSCFYRYSVVDVDRLRSNLDADDELLRETVAAYVRASVLAIPTGKQNSMAAHNPPSLVLAIARESGSCVSLANAFAQPIRPTAEADLVAGSIKALQTYLQRISGMYGAQSASAFYIADRSLEPIGGSLQLQDKGGLSDLVKEIESRAVGAGL